MAHKVGDSVSKCKAQIEKLGQQLKKLRDERKGTCDLPSSKEGKNVPSLGAHQLKQRKLLRGHFGKVYAMSWCLGEGKDELLVSASQDGKLIVWDSITTNKRMLVPLRSAWVMTVAFSNSGNLLACGGLDNVCSVYKFHSGPLDEKGKDPTPAYTLEKHDGYLSSCKFIGNDDRRLVSASGDGSVILWDIAGQRPTNTFLGHSSDVMSVAPTDGAEGGDVFISGGCDSLALVWDARTGTCVQTHDGHESDINSICVFPDPWAFGTASDDSTCRLFDRRCWGQLNAFQNTKVVCSITSVGFSSSGRYLFAGFDDFTTQVWDTLKGTIVAGDLAPRHENRVSCLGVNRAGTALCTGSWDSLLKCWG